MRFEILEPGLESDLPNDVYQAQAGWLSSSYLKSLLPERYKQPATTEALDFGTLFHTLVLEPDRLGTPDQLDALLAENGITVLDPLEIGLKADGKPAASPTSTQAWKDRVAEVTAAGGRVITQDQWDDWTDQVLAMREAVRRHDTANALMYGPEGVTEESAFAVVDGVPCRARFDRRIPGAILDLKTSRVKPGKQSILRAVIDYGYDLSAAHYLAVAQELGLDVQGFGFVFVSNAEPYYVTVCDLDDAFLARGRALRALAIDRHLNRADPYEGASGYLTLECPRWAELETA